MATKDDSPSTTQPIDLPKLNRTNLMDLATDLLRKSIISGQNRPGTKLVERHVAQLLDISRAPARDALMQLEKEGLVVSKSDARYVIEFNEQDIAHLHQVRYVLEKLAVELVIDSLNEQGKKQLLDVLSKMEGAVASKDRMAYIESDVEIHRCIWKLSGNPHLRRTLDSMSGPLFMFVANNAMRYGWEETLQLHQDLVHWLLDNDLDQTLASLDRHMENSLQRLLAGYQEVASETDGKEKSSE